MTLRIAAPAKINLHLHVTGKRADGYHLLDSLVCFADIGDELELSPAETLSFEVDGRFSGVLNHNDNSVTQAVYHLWRQPGRPPGVKIKLVKHLPAGAGIGGGSADAAACIRGLTRIWPDSTAFTDMRSLACVLGSDVPVCLNGQTIIVRGTGEMLRPAPIFPPLPALLIWPNVHASTPDIFRAASFKSYSAPAVFADRYDCADDIIAALAATRNDLSPAAIARHPVIGDALRILQDIATCRMARMSGSGATVFGLFADMNAAVHAAEHISAIHPDWWVMPTMLNAV